MRGLHYLRALLAVPGSEILPLALAAGRSVRVPSDSGPLLDAPARNVYRRRIRQLDDELAPADRTGDSIAAEKAHREREALIGELRRATGAPDRGNPTANHAPPPAHSRIEWRCRAGVRDSRSGFGLSDPTGSGISPLLPESGAPPGNCRADIPAHVSCAAP
jgi:hypothetical protein